MDTYSLGRWLVTPGREDDFVARWKDLAKFFYSLEHPPPAGTGVLIRSLQEPSLYYSFGPWDDPQHVVEMRMRPEAGAIIGDLVGMCTDASAGSFEVVARG